MSTIFKKIIDKEIPADVVYEDDQCLAFRDVNPVAPTHILIIPKREIAQLDHMSADDAPLMGHLMYVATLVAKQENLPGFRLVVNSGASAGQSVFHLHLHVIGGRGLSWPPG